MSFINMPTATSTQLPILHFNDVYRVSQKYTPPGPTPSSSTAVSSSSSTSPSSPAPPKQEYISAAQFAQQLAILREQWPERKDGERDGLVLFSGDVFSPSVESTITRGSHMVPLLNALSIDASVTGNHDFDHSYAHLTKLIDACNFPWLLSNIHDKTTDAVPKPLKEFLIFDRCGVRVGIIGLVEADWIATIPSFPPEFKHLPMKETALSLSKKLRDPEGEHKVDLIIALTHSRVGNDIRLASELGAVSGLGKDAGHGVDMLLGGHDHIYYIGKGATEWQGWDRPESIPGTEEDSNAMLIKSGTDFRDLSSFTLELASNPSSSIRSKIITSISHGTRHQITPETPTSQPVQDLIDSLIKNVSETLEKPACLSLTEWDCRSEVVRTGESAFGNWVADVLVHAYSESLDGKADCVINCGGTLRGDSTYGPGLITLGDILEILPFEDPVVVIEMDGPGIWACMESALSKYPAHEGRFPVISGLNVVWDSRLPPGQRVKSIDFISHLSKPQKPGKKEKNTAASLPATPSPEGSNSGEDDSSDDEGVCIELREQPDGTKLDIRRPRNAHVEPVSREKGGRTYKVVTREYMAEGYDGFDVMKGCNYLVDGENGAMMSLIIRHFLLGSTYIWRKKKLLARLGRTSPTPRNGEATTTYLSPKTRHILQRKQSSAAAPIEGVQGSAGEKQDPAPEVVKHSWSSIRNALRISRAEHMSEVDSFDGEASRQRCLEPASVNADGGKEEELCSTRTIDVSEKSKGDFRQMEEDVAIVAPALDGRLKDLARSQ